MTTSGQSVDTPVLIAGGGPVGLSLAVELGLRGVECVVVEPRLEPTRLRPRAKTLNTRTMEHFRRWGLADRLRAAAPLPVSWSQDVCFRTTFLGQEIARFHGVLGLGDEDLSPERGQQMPQYVLEDMLRAVVADLPTVDLRLGWRVTGIAEDAMDDVAADDVEVQVRDPSGAISTIRAQYVAGADGGRSLVRSEMGATYEGTTALRPNTGIVFRSDQLGALDTHDPAVQTWVLNQQTPGMMGPIDRDGLWWLIAFGVDGTVPGLDAQRLVRGAIGRDLPVEVISTDPWTARMELVDRCRRGRVFLIGDAAHLNPPFGGHGLNTGIGDAVDLGWKLAASLDGWGGPGLLDSYEAERRPLHRRVIDEAASNMATLAPELASADLDAAGPEGESARQRAKARIEETKRAEYFSLDLVLGHRYDASPIIASSTGPAGAWQTRACPGRRLPHRWVAPEMSTLDLVGPGHVVLTADPHSAEKWVAAHSTGVPFNVAQVDHVHLEALGATTIVVRPDQVVAWCGDLAPAEADELPHRLAGRPTETRTLCVSTVTAITNVRIFDGHSSSGPTTVLVEGGVIVAGPTPDGAEIVDGTNCTLMPGLIDTHVHVAERRHLEAASQWGITTLLDMGAPRLEETLALRDCPGLPTVKTAGRPASGPGSMFITSMGMPASSGVSGPDDASRFVAERVAEGSDYIKIIVEDPSFPGTKPLQPDTIAALVTAAHEVGLLTVAHVVSPDTLRTAVRAGVDVVTHTAVTAGLDPDFEHELGECSVIIIPTLSMMEGVVHAIGGKLRFRLLSIVVSALRMKYEHAESTVAMFKASGKVVLAGTDANDDAHAPFSPPHGESLHEELGRLVHAGLTPVEALQGATSRAASTFGLTDRGTITPGLRADLVLCAGDPSLDISATRDIRGVWIAGARVR